MSRSVFGAVLLFLAALAAACGVPRKDPSEGPDSTWYNTAGLRAVFGDFEPAASVYITDPAQKAELIERGQYVVESAAACGSCHGATARPGAPLSGGRLMRDEFGEVYAPNITPSRKTGIGGWNVLEIMRAVRASIDHNGRPLSLDLHSGYRWMSDYDAKAVAVYLQSLKPRENEVERRGIGGFERNRWGLFSKHSDVAGYVAAPPRGANAQYGRYLANHVARCSSCHTGGGGFFSPVPFGGAGEAGGEVDVEAGEFPAGGPDIRGTSETGLLSWSADDIVNYLSTGKTPGGEKRRGVLCPWPFFSRMAEEDRRAIAEYLKGI